MLKENSLSNAQMFAGRRVKKTFLGLQTTMKCNDLNQLQAIIVVMGRLQNFWGIEEFFTFCSLKGAVKGCNTYSETAFAPQSKTFPARSPFTSANCLSSQPRESRDSITLWKHFKAIPFSFCFTCKTDRKHWIYTPTFLPSFGCLSPKATFKLLLCAHGLSWSNQLLLSVCLGARKNLPGFSQEVSWVPGYDP